MIRLKHFFRLALQQHGEEKLGPGKTFIFKSRQKHSAYKECDECQTKRLRVRRAIQEGQPPSTVKQLQREYADHIQWMLGQRDCLERILMMATNERCVVEQSDKCGDYCLHLPGSGGREASSNTALYKYKVSLQANVFGSKLYHLSLLLPNLSTGANFGATSFLTGLCRMIDLGNIKELKRHLLRGFDGDSANVCKVGLGLNCVLVKMRAFDMVQQPCSLS